MTSPGPAASPAVERIPQPHGGALLPGGQPGNKSRTGMTRKVRRTLQRVALHEGAGYVRQTLAQAAAKHSKDRHREAMDCLNWLGKYAVGEVPVPQGPQGQAQQTQVNVGVRVVEPGGPVIADAIKI